MQPETITISKKRLWAGRILSGAAALFCLMDGGMKLFKPPFVVKATLELGYPESAIVGIGVVLLACTILYLIPRTAIMGAVLLTGYFGGAVATYVRISGPLFQHAFSCPVRVLCVGRLVPSRQEFAVRSVQQYQVRVGEPETRPAKQLACASTGARRTLIVKIFPNAAASVATHQLCLL